MLEFLEVDLSKLVVHNIGNSLQEEGMILSKSEYKLKEDGLKPTLLKYFLTPFKGEVFYNFTHDTDLNLNEIFNYASKIFADPDVLFLQSINIAKHLYDKSNHHNIKPGEFYLVYLQHCGVNGNFCDAIGLFKSENKDTFLKVLPEKENYLIEREEGININKLDKGCLIFNLSPEKGYKVCIVDHTNKSEEAQYWKNSFLKLKPNEDSYYHTNNYLHLCKDFCKDVLDKEFQVAKADQIDIVNRSVNYFQKKETFNRDEFINEVMPQEELVNAFKSYKDNYETTNNFTTFDEFDISKSAVKSAKRIFKSVLKLDKNFHIYIHGNSDNIVKGYDEERAMHYYQVFFKKEL